MHQRKPAVLFVFVKSGNWLELRIVGELFPSWVFVIILMPFLVVACWIRSFRSLAYLSFIGQLLSFGGYGIIMVFSFISLIETHPPVQAINWSGIPIFFGMVRKLSWFPCIDIVIKVVFSFAGIGAVLPMKRAMIQPRSYIFVLDIGFVIISSLLLAFGTVGYCGYGNAVNSGGITLNLPQDSFWTIITQTTLIVGIYATYPIVMYPVIEILDELLFDNPKVPQLSTISKNQKFWASNLMRAILVVITSIIAISIPYFSLFVSLVGALGSSFIAFIMPCILHLKLFPKASRVQLYSNRFLVVFGVIASAISVTITVFQLIEAIFGVDFAFA